MSTSTAINATTVNTRSDIMLSRVFAFDRLTAITSATVLTLGSIPVARLLDWSTWIVLAVGIALIPYGHLLHQIVRSGRYRSRTARLTAVADGLWVLASVAILLVWPDATSTIGTWIVAAQAVMVADIGLFKMLGWRRS